MPTYPLHSSAITSIDYEPRSQTLVVHFTHRGSHTYSGVSESLVKAFVAAPSAGQFFNANIRPLSPGKVGA